MYMKGIVYNQGYYSNATQINHKRILVSNLSSICVVSQKKTAFFLDF